jgi:hypothetical protein
MPPEPTEETTKEDILYFKAVKDHMIHQCSGAINGCYNKHGICKRGYGNRDVRPVTFVDENGFPTYRRRTERDLKVVPHNREILLDWNGHINVEYAGTTYTVLYLYKYLFKGNKKEKAKIMQQEENPNLTEEEEKNEILMYLKGRIICSMDSMWRFFHFQTYPSAKPSVMKINVKLPDHVEKLLQEQKLSDMTVYFARPQILADYKFTEFYHHFSYDRKLPKRFRGKTLWTEHGSVPFDENDFCVDVTAKVPALAYAGKTVYIFSKDSRYDKAIVRMSFLYPSAGEIFYLRILVKHRPAMSFLEYRTCNGTMHRTFQQSAIAHGYVDEYNETAIAFEEMKDVSTAAELRSFVVMLTVEGFPTLCIMENEAYVKILYDDFLHDNECRGTNTKLAMNKMLIDLKRRFDTQGKEGLMEACGFPMPIEDLRFTELERHRLLYPALEQEALFHQLCIQYPNTPEQEEVFQLIKAAVDNQQQLFLFIQGSAGTGKSTFANKVNAYVRSKNLISLGCCANALACQVYGENAEYTTAHDLFGIPVIEDDEDLDDEAELLSLYFNQLEKQELLLAASLYNWDEILSNHKHCLATAFKICKLFRNKVLLLMGDWRQCPAVVKNADMNEIVNACMLNSPYWEQVVVREFTVNLRLIKQSVSLSEDVSVREAAEQFNREQEEYLHMLDIIGDGRPLTHETSDCVIDLHSENIPFDGSRHIALPKLKSIFDQTTAINWLFPNGFDPDMMHLKAILCTTNVIVNEWNTVIQALNINPVRQYRSMDRVKGIDDPHGYLANMITESVLERYNVPGVPKHILNLKKDDICMIMRNLNRKEGLAKNLRVKIVSLHEHCIRVCTLNPVGRRYYNIPRIRFTISLPYGRSMQMERKQFPLQLAYSMTYNKSQGQQFQDVLVDIRNNPFTHGHLYVALSRIRISRNIRLFTTPPAEGATDDPPYVTNVVYEKLKLSI